MRANIFLLKMLGQVAQLFKPLGFIAAVRLLQVLGVFGKTLKWGRFITNNFYESIYNSLTGMNFVWLFMRGQTMPVQMAYVNSFYRHKAEWSFNARTQEWVHRDAPYGAHHRHFPFVMTRLTTPDGEYDLTEYFSNQRYYFNEGRKTMPLPAQLLNMWCMDAHHWFTADELRNSYFTIMGDDCNDYTIPVILRRPDDVRVYGRLFGIDIPVSDSEESSDVSNEYDEMSSEGSSEEDDGSEESESGSEESESGSEKDASQEAEEGSNQESEEDASQDAEEDASQEDEEEVSSQEEQPVDATQPASETDMKSSADQSNSDVST